MDTWLDGVVKVFFFPHICPQVLIALINCFRFILRMRSSAILLYTGVTNTYSADTNSPDCRLLYTGRNPLTTPLTQIAVPLHRKICRSGLSTTFRRALQRLVRVRVQRRNTETVQAAPGRCFCVAGQNSSLVAFGLGRTSIL